MKNLPQSFNDGFMSLGRRANAAAAVHTVLKAYISAVAGRSVIIAIHTANGAIAKNVSLSNLISS